MSQPLHVRALRPTPTPATHTRNNCPDKKQGMLLNPRNLGSEAETIPPCWAHGHYHSSVLAVYLFCSLVVFSPIVCQVSNGGELAVGEINKIKQVVLFQQTSTPVKIWGSWLQVVYATLLLQRLPDRHSFALPCGT